MIPFKTAAEFKVVTGPPTPPVARGSVVVHGPNDRPVEPAVGTIYRELNGKFAEQWDGREWVPLKKTADGR